MRTITQSLDFVVPWWCGGVRGLCSLGSVVTVSLTVLTSVTTNYAPKAGCRPQ